MVGITITRNVRLHELVYTWAGFTNFFLASTHLSFGNLAPVAIRYLNVGYEAPPSYRAQRGFYICRNDANPHNPNYAGYSSNDVSTRISPLWDTWFKETVVYNPQSGDLAYSINDVLQTSFNVGVMPQTNSPSLVLTFDSLAWWTGHQHVFDNLLVTQEVPNLDPANRDTDRDGMPDWAEMLAGTSATNPASCLSLHSVAPSQVVPGGYILEWSSFAGINYSVNRSTNLLATPNPFMPIRSGIPGLPGTTTYTDSDLLPTGPCFYRISVDY